MTSSQGLLLPSNVTLKSNCIGGRMLLLYADYVYHEVATILYGKP